jgi:ethanolamine utilization cobalamin adenosyltransferase
MARLTEFHRQHTFIERDIFYEVDEDDIIQTFTTLGKRRVNTN